MADFAVGQKVRMKKPHPCGSEIWEVVRIGMDFRIKCVQCGRSLMLPRAQFEKGVREVIKTMGTA
ncbi:MAG: DUF951 domain-containing protein [Dethiobacter sp.]|nr:DUF951 domain-containing protein [Dethiobacter sp.]MBS3897349.1 DUF951 domain-containing protein [Dethiobacter sp.]MBS3983852.1 DUF951 domain-containing protein [Dethiobacter sp.]MCL4463612.1 DUF951 domain-containing protein [Bacillota bacterium]MCL5992898.1 DUF951 domain-containing protein [Bacillota bacterium]